MQELIKDQIIFKENSVFKCFSENQYKKYGLSINTYYL